MGEHLTRRDFIVGGACGSMSVLAGLALPSCAGARRAAPDAALEGGAVREIGRYSAGTERAFPFLEVSGSPREIGRGIGRRFGDLVRAGLERRSEWFSRLKGFAAGEGRGAYDTFVAAAKKHTPRAMAELEGWAEGSGVPFEDLMVLNLKAEISALVEEREALGGEEASPGCSTIVLAGPDRVIHLHNEDGADAYADLMFVLLCRPTDGPAYLTLSYPGILPGNAPAVNERGLVQTTNFISSREVRLGVGRYFLDRMILEAASIEEAIEWSSHPERAYAFHHVFTSVAEKRSVAIEVTPSRKAVHPIEGLYLHTNHLVLDGMVDEAQDEEYLAGSSGTRWRVLSEWARAAGDPGALGAGDLVAAASSHEGAPYSPCRHPEGDVRGFTLATAVFEAPAGTMRLYKSQPCNGRCTDYEMPR